VGRVQHWIISVADAQGLDAPTEEGQLQELTERWEVPNNGIDLFIVHDMNIPSNNGILLGRSAVDGPCEDKDQKGMEASTEGARDARRQTDSKCSSLTVETTRVIFEPRKCPHIGGYSSETRKRRFASECVVGLGGFEPSTRPL
jgi:hypothetical protein